VEFGDYLDLDLAKRGFGLGFQFPYPPTGSPIRVVVFLSDASMFILLRGVDCVLCCLFYIRYKQTEKLSRDGGAIQQNTRLGQKVCTL
jgi:hypothetical protein